MLDIAMERVSNGTATINELKGAIDTSAKLVGANAPDRSVQKIDGSLAMSMEEDEYSKRIDESRKLMDGFRREY